MHTHALPRLMLVTITTAFISATLLATPTKADSTIWSDTGSGEAIFVRACQGFDITTSYTANRTFKLISNSTGDQVVERLYVGFVGTLANDTTGQTLPYDGRFTRISDYHRNSVTITDLEVRFGVDTPGQFSIAIDRAEMDLPSIPTEVVKTLVPNVLHLELCDLLASPGELLAPKSIVDIVHTENTAPAKVGAAVPQSIVDLVHTENSAQPDPESDDLTPWTELDRCDTSPPGRSC